MKQKLANAMEDPRKLVCVLKRGETDGKHYSEFNYSVDTAPMCVLLTIHILWEGNLHEYFAQISENKELLRLF